MKPLKKYVVYFFSLAVIALSACSGGKLFFQPRNLVKTYHPRDARPIPHIKIYHTDDQNTEISLWYAARSFVPFVNDSLNQIEEIQIKLYPDDIREDIVEKRLGVDDFDYSTEKVKASFILATKPGHNYLAEIITNYHQQSSRSFVRIIRSGSNFNQFIKIYTSENSLVSDDHMVKVNENIHFESNHFQNGKYRLFYFHPFPEALHPPSAIDSINELSEPDSVYTIFLDKKEGFSPKNEGVYYFTRDDSLQNGFSLKVFNRFYPDIRKPQALYDALNYLTNTDSLGTPKNTKSYKLLVDNFWLERAENMERSRNLIKIYYNRIRYANIFFTSYREGWKTDRGLIYVMYGLPDEVYISQNSEKWSYNPTGINPGLIFNFNVKDHPLSTQYYELDREKLKFTNWESIQKAWLEGNVIYHQN